jgi:pSer/pThr/pTyr-binding forkhead associated (FHA) protein/ribosomal protein L40E
MIVCPNCNHQNPEGATQCEACYAPLPTTIACPNCGASVQSDATFCGQCGFNLQAEVGQTFAANSAFTAEKKETPAVNRADWGEDIPVTTVPSMSDPKSGMPTPNQWDNPWDEPQLPDFPVISQPQEADNNGWDEQTQSIGNFFDEQPPYPTQPETVESNWDRTPPPRSEPIVEVREQTPLPQPEHNFESNWEQTPPPQPEHNFEPNWDRTPPPQPEPRVEFREQTPPPQPEPRVEFREQTPPPQPEPIVEVREQTPPPQPEPIARTEKTQKPEEVFIASPTSPRSTATSNNPTTIQTQKVSLYHVQTDTSIEITPHLSIVHLGKPNSQIPPDVDVSGFPNSEIVSRVHADIRVEGDVYFIEDVGSSNGTYVNHTPLLSGNRHRLRSGDRIGLGKGDKVTFIFQIS